MDNEKKLFTKSCKDILQYQQGNGKIHTEFTALDNYLHGGIALRQITEFVGKPGTGKTQMCLQLCLNVQKPKEENGIEGKAIYLDTRQDFSPFRLSELAKHLEQRLAHIKPKIKATQLLQNVHYLSCPSAAQLIASVIRLRSYLTANPDIKLVVIDSLSFSMRMLEDVPERTSLLFELHDTLRQLLHSFDIALVITNEMTHRLTGSGFTVCPALGEIHSHLINDRIWFIREQDNTFEARVGKSIKKTRRIGNFKIRRVGIRGC